MPGIAVRRSSSMSSRAGLEHRPQISVAYTIWRRRSATRRRDRRYPRRRPGGQDVRNRFRTFDRRRAGGVMRPRHQPHLQASHAV
jgi:hypothetical protein